MRQSSKILLFIAFLTGLACTNVWANAVFNKIKSKTETFFHNKLHVAKSDLKINYKSVPANLNAFSECDIELYSQKKSVKPGSQVVWVKMSRNQKIIKKLPVTVEVFVRRDVLFARYKIPRGTRLDKNALEYKQMDLGKDWDQYFNSMKQLSGTEAKQVIRKGVPITARQIKQTPLVNRGENVTIQIKNKNMTISTNGIAKEDGINGERIRLKIGATGKTVYGIVKNNNLVVVSQD